MEKFYLAAENYSWVKGGYFFLKIKVLPQTEKAVESGAETIKEEINSAGYKAQIVGQNKKVVKEKGGEKVKLILSVMNKGTATWQKYLVRIVEPATVAGLVELSFADASWEDANVVLSGEGNVAPDGFLRLVFNFARRVSRKLCE